MKDNNIKERIDTELNMIKVNETMKQNIGKSLFRLIRIAINSCKNIMRTRWFRFPMLSIEEQQYLDICKSLEDVVIEKDTISKAIMSLNKSDRELIILYYYQELSVKEISLITKKKENAINQRLRRARERLKDYLKEEQYEG